MKEPPLSNSWRDHALADYGLHPEVADELLARPGVPGRITRVDRGSCLVATGSDILRAAPDPAVAPATGDWVVLAPADTSRIAQTLPRATELIRRDPVSGEQVLAANADVVFVVVGLDRPVNLGRVERFLLIALESGAAPILVAAKSDLVDDGPARAAQAAALAPGVAGHAVSSVTGEGVDDLAACLAGNRTAALIGESGSGKSSLVNTLVGHSVRSTGPVRDADQRGRHTTTARELVRVPGGVLIDTPGVREVGILGAEQGLAAMFRDVREHAARCRFGDCTHEAEPGCAVVGAVASGTLSAERRDRYRHLRQEMDAGSALRAEHDRRRAERSGRRRESPRRWAPRT